MFPTLIFFSACLRVTVAMIKGFVWFMLPHHSASLKEGRTGTHIEHELMQRPRRMLFTGFLLMTGSACFLVELRTSSTGGAPPTMDWVLSQQTLRKCPTGLSTHSLISRRHFLS